MIKSITGKLFYALEIIWQNFRRFFHSNDSLFELFFILLYFLEQILLVYFTMIFRRNIEYLPYIISFFTLTLLATVGVHRFVMESKNKFIKEKAEKLIKGYYEENISKKINSELIEKEYRRLRKLMDDVLEE